MSVTGVACITPAPADGDAMHDADNRGGACGYPTGWDMNYRDRWAWLLAFGLVAVERCVDVFFLALLSSPLCWMLMIMIMIDDNFLHHFVIVMFRGSMVYYD
ncbi:hypothetical protein GE21DRAFT_1021219 [Neurospora crassa]|nr:hypothetical protein GE21DRAFT_1021219 [Neurospora crassa]